MEKARILIVEDEPIIAMELESRLQTLGYEVSSIVNTAEAAIKKAEEDKPDLILMDIRLSGKMDGIEAAEIIRSRFQIPVVFATAYLDQKRIERAKITMPFGYLLKPIQDKDLRITLEMALYVAKTDRIRRQAEKALRESETQYRSFVQSFPGIAYKGNMQFVPAFFHGKVREITGYSEQEITSGNPRWDQVVYEEDLPLILEDNRKIRSMPFSTDREYRIVRKDGQICWVKEYLQNVCDEKDQPIYLNGVILDINEYKLAQDSLRESERKYRDLFEKSKDAILFIENRIFVDCNQAALDMLGYGNRDEFLKSHPSQLSPKTQPDGKNSVEKADEMMDIAIKNGSHRFEWNHVKANGDVFPVEVLLTTISTETGRQVIHTVWRDITERKLAEEAIRDSEEKYRNVVEFAVEAICVVQDGLFRFFNPEAEKLFGYSKEELKRLPVSKTVYAEDMELLDSIHLKRKKGERILGYSHRIITKDLRIRWVDVKAVSITWNKMPGLLIFLSDITERKRSEELIIQTEKMMSIGGLAAGIAHELNNPLAGMLQGVQNVRRRLSPDLKSNLVTAKETGTDLQNLQWYMEKRGIIAFLEGIQDSGYKASQIIANMLQFSRKSESRMAPTNLEELVENTLDLFTKGYDHKKNQDNRHISIVREFSPNLPLIRCTKTEIEQVLLNLLTNAAWSMVNGQGVEPPRIIIRLANEKRVARIEIEDNGPGMNEETRKRVFEPFFTTKPEGEGTGLGLSVSYMIITANHKGSMEVDSAPGKGCRFIIRLPFNEEQGI